MNMQTMKKIRILIAEEQALVRKALVLILKENPRVDSVAEASTSDEINEILSTGLFHVLLTDTVFLENTETLKSIRSRYPFTKILALSTYQDRAHATKLLNSGCSGYITKNTQPEELFQAISVISEGRKYLSSDLLGLLLSNYENRQKIGNDLTRRESEIVRLISKGYTSKEISEKLFISIKTVEAHRGKIYKKLKVKKVVELVNLAKENMLLV